MKKNILAYIIIIICFGFTESSAYNYTDYTRLRNDFDQFCTNTNSTIKRANNEYLNSLNMYQQCSSNSWRSAFEIVIPDIDSARLKLDEYKRKAYETAGRQNSEWLKAADEHNISRIKPEDDITDFVIWYKNHISFMESGPYHELQLYVNGYQNLTKVYKLMFNACNGRSQDVLAPEVLVPAIRKLLDEVKSWIGIIN